MSEQAALFDARMREHFSAVDTAVDFDQRVMRRIAALGTVSADDLRDQFERKRQLARRRMRRDVWSNAVTIAGIGAAAGVIVWRHAPAIMQWTQSGGIADLDPWLVAGTVAAALAGSLWPLLRRLPTSL